MKTNTITQKHTHLQAAQSSRTDQSLQKSVLFTSPRKLKNKIIPSLQKNKTLRPHSSRQTETNFNGGHLTTHHLRSFQRVTDDSKTKALGGNSTYPKVAVQLLNQALCFYQSLCLVDSEVLLIRYFSYTQNRFATVLKAHAQTAHLVFADTQSQR